VPPFYALVVRSLAVKKKISAQREKTTNHQLLDIAGLCWVVSDTDRNV
jgi:hypothetical protein